ncbi:MAG: asparagine synthase-related protein [Candidatus Paceibacterota bacterium]
MIPTMMNDLTNPPLDNVAVYLSGGIDSSVVLYHVTKKCKNVRTYTAVFGVSNDESAKAQRVANYFGTTHTEVFIFKSDILDSLPYVMRLFDRPRYNIWPFFLARRAFYDEVKTAYIGEGSDEIFGYPDRGYLEGWAGQLIYVRPTYDIVNSHFGITLKAPFTELHHKLIADYGSQSAPLAYFDPPNKSYLRSAYKRLLPDWILNTPTTAPAFTNYTELGITKHEFQIAATRAWLGVHDVH